MLGMRELKYEKRIAMLAVANNNVNAFLTCTTRSTLVYAQLIIVPLIYSLYFPSLRWLEPSLCLHSLRVRGCFSFSLACYTVYRGVKKAWSFSTRDRTQTYARTHACTYDKPRGHDVEIKRTRKRTALVDKGVVAFMPHPAIRICWSINKNMHAPSISRAYRYHRRWVSDINVKCAKCVQFDDGLRKRRERGWSCCLHWGNVIVCGRTHMRLIAPYYQGKGIQTRGMFIGYVWTKKNHEKNSQKNTKKYECGFNIMSVKYNSHHVWGFINT